MKESAKHIKFSREERLLHRLMLHCADVPGNTGLLHGMTGFAVTLADYSRGRKLRRIEALSSLLMEKVFSSVTDVTPPGLAYGLAGIGWGMEYLIQRGFVKGSGAEILRNLDRRLMLTDVSRLADESLERGLEGIMHYVALHLEGARKDGTPVFDPQYLDAVLRRASMSSNPEIHRLAACIAGEEEYIADPLLFIDADKISNRKKDDVRDLSLREGVAGELMLIINGKGGEDA